MENNKIQHQRHWYPIIIKQFTQEINQVDSTATAENNHQKWLIHVYEQVKATPQLICNYFYDNMIRHKKNDTKQISHKNGQHNH